MVGGPTEFLKTLPRTAPFVRLLYRPSGESLARTRITQGAAGKEKNDRTHRHFCNAPRTAQAPTTDTEHCALSTRPAVPSAPPDVTCEREGVWVVS